jgi:hypothetical protein
MPSKRTKKNGGGAMRSLKKAVFSDQTCNFDRIDANPNQNTQKVRAAVLKSTLISKDGSDFGAFLQNQMKVLCDQEEMDESNSDVIKTRKRRLNLCENMLSCIKSPKELIYVLYDIFHKKSEEKEHIKEVKKNKTGLDRLFGGGGNSDLILEEDDDDDDDDDEGEGEGEGDKSKKKEKETAKIYKNKNTVSFIIFFCNVLVVSLKNYYDKKKSDNPNFKVDDIKVLTDLNTELKNIFKDSVKPILDISGKVDPMFKKEDDTKIESKPHPFYTLILNSESIIEKKFEERMKKEASGTYNEDSDAEPVGNPSLFGGIVMFFLGMAFLIEYSGFTPKK